VRKTHPEDRVNIKELGQTYYFNQEYAEALYVYDEGVRIDPEDAQAHYNMMLVNKKLGNPDKAREHQNYYLKYKLDEEARSISQSARLKYPHANNEAQLVHSHKINPTN
jgi:tetratricopeptide (TPR) repeat protein